MQPPVLISGDALQQLLSLVLLASFSYSQEPLPWTTPTWRLLSPALKTQLQTLVSVASAQAVLLQAVFPVSQSLFTSYVYLLGFPFHSLMLNYSEFKLVFTFFKFGTWRHDSNLSLRSWQKYCFSDNSRSHQMTSVNFLPPTHKRNCTLSCHLNEQRWPST